MATTVAWGDPRHAAPWRRPRTRNPVGGKQSVTFFERRFSGSSCTGGGGSACHYGWTDGGDTVYVEEVEAIYEDLPLTVDNQGQRDRWTSFSLLWQAYFYYYSMDTINQSIIMYCNRGAGRGCIGLGLG